MRQMRDYSDERSRQHCAFCGGETGTRDHVPSRVLLREPYPDNLPVVPACGACNASFSLDEEYVACFLAAVVAGTTDPSALGMTKAARTLADKPALRRKIEASRRAWGGATTWAPELERVLAVVQKLAQGHVYFEIGEPHARTPDEIWAVPLQSMTPEERSRFENPESAPVWPEVGSRSMQRLVVLDEGVWDEGWIEVQPSAYRYHVNWLDGVVVRIVMGEYLAAWVRWDA
jgi:hypothetical protein